MARYLGDNELWEGSFAIVGRECAAFWPQLVNEVCAKPNSGFTLRHAKGPARDLRVHQPAKTDSLARRATDLDPSSAPAWDTLGSVHADQGALRKASAAYKTAIRLFSEQQPPTRKGRLEPTIGRQLAETLTRKAQAKLKRPDERPSKQVSE